jgi:hypothetical protein
MHYGAVFLNFGKQMSKDITVVIVDTASHTLAKFAIEQTLKAIPCKEVITFSDRSIIDGAKFVPIRQQINLYDYSEIVLKQLWPHVETEYVLIIQWDGMAVNPTMWTDEFLKYDYIGSIWPWPQQGINMGNGGFSLRSSRLIDACRDTEVKLGGFAGQNEDIAICVEHRKLLQDKYNIKYAPAELAQQFAVENEWLGTKTFGFHGMWNIPRFLPEADIRYVIDNMPIRFWKDLSKVQPLLNILVEQYYDNIAQEVYNKATSFQ